MITNRDVLEQKRSAPKKPCGHFDKIPTLPKIWWTPKEDHVFEKGWQSVSCSYTCAITWIKSTTVWIHVQLQTTHATSHGWEQRLQDIQLTSSVNFLLYLSLTVLWPVDSTKNWIHNCPSMIACFTFVVRVLEDDSWSAWVECTDTLLSRYWRFALPLTQLKEGIRRCEA